MRLVTILAAVSLCRLSGVRAVQINKLTGGYEDIVVAIHPSVKHDDRIVDNIKALFTSASSFLHRATRGLVHFGSVTIALPDTWPPRPNATATTTSLFPGADVRVAAENPQYGDTPYTLQPRGCGERGEYIHLTPRFLAELGGSTADTYGSPAYQLVHEWAHFRYGVFDEYGDPESSRYPTWYCERGMVRASTCSAQVKFTAHMDSGKPCLMYKGCRISAHCKARFSLRTGNATTSSIMFMPYLKGVSEFCDNADKKHNAFAPNKHNHLCNRKSTWEVIRSNEDFIGLSAAYPSENVRVNFKEVQKRNGILGRIIFVLDVSGSMDTDNRIGHLKVAASHFVQVLIPDEIEVGLVTFNENAGMAYPLTPVRTETRKALVGKVGQLGAVGGTCIECGLKKALQMFKAKGQHGEGSVIILMTDGEDRSPSSVIVDDLVADGVVVNTIAFGTGATQSLEMLALRTGGKPFALREGQTNIAAALESAFFDATVSLLDDDRRPVVILDAAANVVSEHKFDIIVDEDLGGSTTITVLCDQASKLQTQLLYPDGHVCENCHQAGPSTTDSYITFKVPDIATPGTWTLVVSHSDSSGDEVHVHVRATSLARDPSEEPVAVRAFLKRSEVSSAEDAAIYAEVSKGPDAVLHAKVVATVIRPREPYEVDVELFDDGLGADVTANDGIYSAHFTQFEGKGRYSVSARVETGNNSVITRGRQASGGLPAPHIGPDTAEEAARPLEADYIDGIPFDRFVYVDQAIEVAEPHTASNVKAPKLVRYAEGGSFRVSAVIEESAIPPGPIQDLVVEDAFVADNASRVVVLAWTCPGAHMSSGNASWIELRAATSLADLIKNFSSGVDLYADAAQRGKISAGSVGSRQRVRILLPDALIFSAQNESRLDFYFAAKAWNAEGLQSAESNVARATFERPPELVSAPSEMAWWVIPVIVLVAVIAAAVLVTTGVRLANRRKKCGNVTSSSTTRIC
ncbi:calcium-activated chloride channel regulator 1-like isoform X2 [Haemaphysalis longicornis]